MPAERKIVTTFTDDHYKEVTKLLEPAAGWKLDPFFHKTGRPWTLDNQHVWVLVRGTPREIQALDPFVLLPEPRMSPEDQAFVNKWKDVVDVVEIKAESVTDGTVRGLVAQGWEVNNVLKGLVSLVKRDKGEPPRMSLEEQLEREGEEKYRHEHGLDEPPVCEKGVHEPMKGNNLLCQSCDQWVAEEPGVTPTCSWKGWDHEEGVTYNDPDSEPFDNEIPSDCPSPETCLIERGPLFDAIKAMDECKDCPRHEAWLKGAQIQEASR